MPDDAKCPKCGALPEGGGKGPYGFYVWECGTSEKFGGGLEQSETCRAREPDFRIRELESALARVTLENERLTREIDNLANTFVNTSEYQRGFDAAVDVLKPEISKKLADRDEAVGLLREIAAYDRRCAKELEQGGIDLAASTSMIYLEKMDEAMTDWIKAAAREIGSAHLNSALEPTKYSYPTDKMIADIILRHAPPQPGWREMPTCLGRWDTDKGKCYWIESEESLKHQQEKKGILWYGPIPPAQETK